VDDEAEGGRSSYYFGRCLGRAFLYYLPLRQAWERHSLELHNFALDCFSDVSHDTFLSSLSLTASLTQCSDDKNSQGSRTDATPNKHNSSSVCNQCLTSVLGFDPFAVTRTTTTIVLRKSSGGRLSDAASDLSAATTN
jgi:hypothetical protein